MSGSSLSIRAQRGTAVYSNNRLEWEAMLQASSDTGGRPLFYAGPSWLEAWAEWAAADHDAEPLTFIAEDEVGNWLGVLPLALQRARFDRHRFQALTVAGWPYTDTVEIPSTSLEARVALLGFAWYYALNELRDPWHALLLREIGVDGPTHEAVDAFAAQEGLQVFRTITARSPVLDLQQFNVDNAPRRKSLRRRLGKFRRKMEREGVPEFRFHRLLPEEVDERLAFCTEVDAHSWKAENDSASFLVDGRRRPFVRHLWHCLAEENALALATLTLDGRPLGYHWGPIEDDRFLSFSMAYDDEFRSHGVGTVILDDMIEQGQELGLRLIDASRGGVDGSHILGQYPCQERVQQMVVLYRPNLAGRSLKLRREVIAPMLRRLRRRSGEATS